MNIFWYFYISHSIYKTDAFSDFDGIFTMFFVYVSNETRCNTYGVPISSGSGVMSILIGGGALLLWICKCKNNIFETSKFNLNTF